MRDLYNGGNADRIEKRKKAQHPAAGLKPTASRFLFCWCGLYHWATTSALISGISLTSPNFLKVDKPNFSSRDRNSGDTKSWNWMKNFIRDEMSATNPRSGQLRSCHPSDRECVYTRMLVYTQPLATGTTYQTKVSKPESLLLNLALRRTA